MSRAAVLGTWHQVLSSVSTTEVNVGVDGYFTRVPESSSVWLRRRETGAPVLVSYPVGLGRVIATTLFTDWGSRHNLVSPEEGRLFGDLLRWRRHGRSLAG